MCRYIYVHEVLQKVNFVLHFGFIYTTFINIYTYIYIYIYIIYMQMK